jgi:hypothetical protein
MKQKPAYTTKEYNYSTKSGNLNAEAVGVVKARNISLFLRESWFSNL